MNIYQKALDRLSILTGDPIQVFKTGERMILGLREVVVLQELVNEFTKNQEPKERCRECDECEFLNYNYCHNCGNEFRH